MQPDTPKDKKRIKVPENWFIVGPVSIGLLILLGWWVSFCCTDYAVNPVDRQITVLPVPVVLKCFAVSFIALLVQICAPFLRHDFQWKREPATTRQIQYYIEQKKTTASAAQTGLMAARFAQGTVEPAAKDAAENAMRNAPQRSENVDSKVLAAAYAENTEKAAEKKSAADRALEDAKEKVKPVEEMDDFGSVWAKISQPEYAIGLGLISQSDYSAISGTYQNQSTLTVGLAIPLFLLTSIALIRVGQRYPAYAQRTSFHMIYALLGAAQTALFIMATDLKHKFETSTQAIVAAGYIKLIMSNKSSKSSTKSVADQINDALDAATILRTTDLKILPGDLKIVPGDPPAPAPATEKSDGS